MCGERTFRISIPAPGTHKKNPFPMREGVLGDRLPTFPGVRRDVGRPQLNLTRIPGEERSEVGLMSSPSTKR